MSLQQQIQQIVCSELAIPPDELTSDLRYGETPEWDSNSHMVLIMAIEEAYSVEFDSDEIVNLVTLDAIRDALISKGVSDPSNA